MKKFKRIVFLDYLRVLAIFMVLVIHATESFYFGADGNTFVASRADAVWVTVFEALCRSCVPLFVMASSYLLFPIAKPTGEFLWRRIVKILIPFAFWCCVYNWWNRGSWSAMLFNFPTATGGHLWFVPMLFGLYLLMPILSPWAERVSAKELKGWIFVWLFTTTFPFLRTLLSALLGGDWAHTFGMGDFGKMPFLYGECAWNSFGAFHYVSGFIGYLLLGFWFRKFATGNFQPKAKFVTATVWLFGAVLMAMPFFGRLVCAAEYGGWPVSKPYSFAVDLETSIEYCSLGVVATTFAVFLFIRRLTSEGKFYRLVICPLSEASFGVYLVHILILVPVGALLKGVLPTPLAILGTAVLTFALSSAAVLIILRVPVLRRIV